MKWNRFKDRLPVTGANIIVKTEDDKVGIVEFGLNERHFIKFLIDNGSVDGNKDPLCVDYYSDSPEDNEYIAIECAVKWIYPSEMD
jgi:hypothetical protein